MSILSIIVCISAGNLQNYKILTHKSFRNAKAFLKKLLSVKTFFRYRIKLWSSHENEISSRETRRKIFKIRNFLHKMSIFLTKQNKQTTTNRLKLSNWRVKMWNSISRAHIKYIKKFDIWIRDRDSVIESQFYCLMHFIRSQDIEFHSLTLQSNQLFAQF